MDKKNQENQRNINSGKVRNERYDYGRIEKLRKEAWADPRVRKNWEEYYKKLKKVK